MKSFCLCVVLLSTAAICGDAQPRQATVTNLCKVAKDWNLYQGKEVTVQAVYSEETVQAKLLDEGCPDVRVAVEWPNHLPTRMKKGIANLDRVIAEDRHHSAQLVVEGTLFGPVPYTEDEIPSNLPVQLKEKMRRSHKTYGYMNAYDYLLKVTELREIRAASRKRSPAASSSPR